MHTNIILTKLAEQHTWEEEHAVWTKVVQGIEKNLTQPLSSKRAFIRYKASQKMRKLGFK